MWRVNKIMLDKIKVYAFVGPSGTGKSYRAQMVANENNIRYIIDDGLLVSGNNVVGGNSAKKAPTKIETVKKAIFIDKTDREEMKAVLKKLKPESILILGTSDDMVEKIASNLGLHKPEKTIYINQVATDTEMETARRIRTTEGKHVIPVPTFELKKDFSGYILDPLQIFKSKGKDNKPYMSEKSMIRPTFSYLGNYTISDSVLKDIIEHLSKKAEAIYKIARIRIEKTSQGVYIYIEIIIKYGYNVITSLQIFKKHCVKEIENLTAMNVEKIQILAKGIFKEETPKES